MPSASLDRFALHIITEPLMLISEGAITFRNEAFIKLMTDLEQYTQLKCSKGMKSYDCDRIIPVSECSFGFLNASGNESFQFYGRQYHPSAELSAENRMEGGFPLLFQEQIATNNHTHRRLGTEQLVFTFIYKDDTHLVCLLKKTEGTTNAPVLLVRADPNENATTSSDDQTPTKGPFPSGEGPARVSSAFMSPIQAKPFSVEALILDADRTKEAGFEEQFQWLKALDSVSPSMWSILEVDKERGDGYRHYTSEAWYHFFRIPGIMTPKRFEKMWVGPRWRFSETSLQDMVSVLLAAEGKTDVKTVADFIFPFLPPTGPRRMRMEAHFIGTSKQTGCPVFVTFMEDVTEKYRIETMLKTERESLSKNLLLLEKVYYCAPLVMGFAEILEEERDILMLETNRAPVMPSYNIDGCISRLRARGEGGIEQENVDMWIEKYHLSKRLGEPVMWECTQSGRTFHAWALHVEGPTYAFILHDITLLKQLQVDMQKSQDILEQTVQARTRQLEEAVHVKSRFLATMSHEIRTPLSGVMGSLLLLEQEELPPQVKETVQVGLVCGEQLLVVINDILDISKMEENQMKLERQPFYLFDILEESLDIISLEAEKKSLELICDTTQLQDAQFMLDRCRLRQIIVNLLSNAVKFSSHGEIVVNAKLKQIEEGDPNPNNDNYEVFISVTDQGIGIPKDVQDDIFQPFNQADTSITRRYGGSGLGLSISRRLAELMGGKMWVESEPGIGSTFYFTILTQKVSVDQTSNNNNNNDNNNNNSPRLKPFEDVHRGKWVIVADHSDKLRSIFQHYLSEWGLKAILFSNSKDALSFVNQNNVPPGSIAIIDSKEQYSDPQNIMANVSIIYTGFRKTRDGPFIKKPLKTRVLYATLTKALDQKEHPLEERADSSNSASRNLIQKIWLTKRVLLAEDNTMNQQIVKRVLQKLGVHDVVVVDNGKKAVEAVSSAHFDLVLMDVMMPEMGGIEATETIRRELSPDRQPIIVALTADIFVENREKCIAAGMQAVLTKPVNLSDLQQLMLQFS